MIQASGSDVLPLLPAIDMPHNMRTIKCAWRGLVCELIDIENLALETKKWVPIRATDGLLFMRINDLAEVFGLNNATTLALVTDKAYKELRDRLLRRKLVLPSWEFLRKFAAEKFSANRDDILNKIKATYSAALSSTKIDYISDGNLHYRRSQTDLPLPVERTHKKTLYTILKCTNHSPPFAEGAFKKVYYALDLQTFKLYAWAKVYLQSKPGKSLEQVQQDFNNEVTIQRSFNGENEFAPLHHFTIYLGKDGVRRAGLLLDLYESNLQTLIESFAACKSDPIVQKALWDILFDITWALVKMEKKMIHHRDIKPENIFVLKTNDGWRAKLGDFGFATTVDDEKLQPSDCSTPQFCAPEFLKAHRMIAKGRQLLENARVRIANYNQSLSLMGNYRKEIDDLMRNSCESKEDLSECTRKIVQRSQAIELWGITEREAGIKLTEEGEAMIKKGSEDAATTKSDVWALGLVLYEMRSCNNSTKLVLDESELRDSWEVSKPYFFNKLINMTQNDLRAKFSSYIIPGSLEELNLRMLTIDPVLRPSAQECLESIEKLIQKKTSFT